MGCCKSVSSTKLPEEVSRDLKLCIDNEDLPRLSMICKLFGSGQFKTFTVNNYLFTSSKGQTMNIPAYCLYKNKTNILKYLNDNYQIDYKLIENILNQQELSGLQLICTNNYIELLEFYVPIYLTLEFKRPSVNSNVTIEFESQDNSKLQLSYTPVQMACELGFIQILHFLQGYFQDREVPSALDIHFIDPTTGENCALIASRACNFSMIKFLHTKCTANFKLLNNKHESAIQILASSAKSSVRPDLFKCLEYLTEQVGVNILHSYEETLLILENSECIAYVERQLALHSIYTSKTEIEYHNRLIKRNSEDVYMREVNIEKSSQPSSIEPSTLIFGSLVEVVELLKNN